MSTRRAAIGLGSSLGNRRAILEGVARRLERLPSVSRLRMSGWYRTPPMRGGTASNPFLNGVALIWTDASPELLLHFCQETEARAFRRRANHWGDRTLDLDVLLVEGLVLNSPTLTLPHPGMHRRDFVMRPLLEVWPDVLDPRTGKPFEQASVALPKAWRVGLPARRCDGSSPFG